MTRIAPIVLAALAAACGDLGNPDLTTGEVRGRIVGGTAAGYVYPVGRPELAAPLAADGSFRVRAPVGASELVLFDGKPVALTAPYGRAGRLSVEVRAAEISDVGERDGAQLSVASAVLAGVRAESGAGCKDPRFQAAMQLASGQLAATDQDKVVASGIPSALLTPLPPGSYQLSVSMAGFRTDVRPFDLTEAPQTLSFDVTLLVDDDVEVRGCEVTSCESSELECCHRGEICEREGRCYATSTSDGNCGKACLASGGNECQAGLSCKGGTCQPPIGATCATYLATLGAACLGDDGCKAAIVNGICHGADSEHAGYCTAPCDVSADCAGFPAGWSCDGDSHACKPHDD